MGRLFHNSLQALERFDSCPVKITVFLGRLILEGDHEVLAEDVLGNEGNIRSPLEHLLEYHETRKFLDIRGVLGEEALCALLVTGRQLGEIPNLPSTMRFQNC